MGDKKGEHVLGLLSDEKLAVPNAPPIAAKAGAIDWGKLRTAQRLMALIDTMTTAHDKEVIAEFERQVARLPARGYGTTEFAMSRERRNALVTSGCSGSRSCLRSVSVSAIIQTAGA